MVRISAFSFIAPLVLCVTSNACDTSAPAEADAIDDEFATFAAAAKEDGVGIAEGSPNALAVLDLVNHAGVERLDVDAKLDKRAAKNIVDHRPSVTGYASLAELDAVPYVGRKVFERLARYAPAYGFGRPWKALMVRIHEDVGGGWALDNWMRMAVSNWNWWVPVEQVRALCAQMDAKGLNCHSAFLALVEAANGAPGSLNDAVIDGAELLGYLAAKHHVDALAISRVGLQGELKRDIQLLDWYVQVVLLHAIDQPDFEDAYAVTDLHVVVEQPDVYGFSLRDIANCTGVRVNACGWQMGDSSLLLWTVPVSCLPEGFETWARRAPRLRDLIDRFGVLKLQTDADDDFVTALALANDALRVSSLTSCATY